MAPKQRVHALCLAEIGISSLYRLLNLIIASIDEPTSRLLFLNRARRHDALVKILSAEVLDDRLRSGVLVMHSPRLS